MASSRSKERLARGCWRRLQRSESQLGREQDAAMRSTSWSKFEPSEWVQGTMLGSGFAGEVFLYASKADSSARVVVKRFDRNKTEYATIVNEVATLRYLRSVCGEHIVCFHSFGADQSYFYLASKPIDQAIDLWDLIGQTPTLSKAQLNRIAGNILFGLFLLHVRGVAHVDVKPDNLLVDKKMHVYYIDFGGACLGRRFCRGESATHGTDFYLPPESADIDDLPNSLEQLKQYDGWAAGITIYSLVNKGFTPVEAYIEAYDSQPEEDSIADYLDEFRYTEQDKIAGKSNLRVEKQLRAIGRSLKPWLQRNPNLRPVAVLQPFPAWVIPKGGGYLTPDGRKMKKIAGRWQDPAAAKQLILKPGRIAPSGGRCRELMCAQGIFDRRGFRRWALAHHPDKCTASKKSDCHALFSQLNQCSLQSIHCNKT